MKTRVIIIAAAAAAAAAVTAVLLSSAGSAQHATPTAYTRVVTPDIPQTVMLCGKPVDLDRSDMWERFDRELTSMIYSHGSTLLQFKRANKYFPVLAPILKKHGVPEDLLYLACVESTLNPRAVSGAGAAGLWQFMKGTAKDYGLEVNDEVDERYNIEKATDAACRFLKKAHAKYNDWPSAMASYNGGMGRISGQLDAQDANTSFDLFLTDETSRYVFRIMATKMLMENPRAFGYILTPDQLYQPAEYKVVEVSGAVDSWADWAKANGCTYAQLREANPWIRDKKLTNKSGKTYAVKVPVAKSLYRKTQTKKVYDKRWTN